MIYTKMKFIKWIKDLYTDVYKRQVLDPFPLLYNNENSYTNYNLRLATLNKLEAVAKKRENRTSTERFYELMRMTNEKQNICMENHT